MRTIHANLTARLSKLWPGVLVLQDGEAYFAERPGAESIQLGLDYWQASRMVEWLLHQNGMGEYPHRHPPLPKDHPLRVHAREKRAESGNK